MTLEDAINDLLISQVQSTRRLDSLGTYAAERFRALGLTSILGGNAAEITVSGIGRKKAWDIAFVLENKARLIVSLKSILKNPSGSVPNRLDDLMGEAANVQNLTPEIVIGYIVVIDEAQDTRRKEDKIMWSDFFASRLKSISIRKSPLWNQGIIEGSWLIKIDSRKPNGSRVSNLPRTIREGDDFFQALIAELGVREPTLR